MVSRPPSFVFFNINIQGRYSVSAEVTCLPHPLVYQSHTFVNYLRIYAKLYTLCIVTSTLRIRRPSMSPPPTPSFLRPYFLLFSLQTCPLHSATAPRLSPPQPAPSLPPNQTPPFSAPSAGNTNTAPPSPRSWAPQPGLFASPAGKRFLI